MIDTDIMWRIGFTIMPLIIDLVCLYMILWLGVKDLFNLHENPSIYVALNSSFSVIYVCWKSMKSILSIKLYVLYGDVCYQHNHLYADDIRI